MDNFLCRFHLPKLDQDKISIFNRTITPSEAEILIWPQKNLKAR